MKKILLTLAILGTLTLRAEAYCYIAWGAGAGFYFTADPSTALLDANGSGLTLVQLIWSSDDVADPVDLADPNYVSGDDEWLATCSTYDSQWVNFTAPTYDDNTPSGHAGGNIYVRVFQDNTPAASEHYYVGSVASNQNMNSGKSPTPDSPQVYQVNRDLANGDAIDGAYSHEIVAVPEPCTLVLFGLGMLAIGGRSLRRNQKK